MYMKQNRKRIKTRVKPSVQTVKVNRQKKLQMLTPLPCNTVTFKVFFNVLALFKFIAELC